jgi:hypothetical protein
MITYKFTYLVSPGVFRTRSVSNDTKEEATVDFRQQLPFNRILRITAVK